MNKCKAIESNCDYISAVGWWSIKFRNEMESNADAALAILAYYLKDTSKLIVSAYEGTPFEIYGEAMRQSSVMIAAAEDSGLFAEAIPRLFCLALEKYSSWCLTYKDITYLMHHMYFRRYIPYAERFMAGYVLDELDAVLEDEALWERCLMDARAKLGERKTIAN